MIPHPSILLTLRKSGVYHYRVGSCDLFNNCAYSKDYKIKKEIQNGVLSWLYDDEQKEENKWFHFMDTTTIRKTELCEVSLNSPHD